MSASHISERTTYKCVDTAAVMEPIPDTQFDAPAGQFWHVEAYVKSNCNGLICPPYEIEKELTCVVCTKYHAVSIVFLHNNAIATLSCEIRSKSSTQ